MTPSDPTTEHGNPTGSPEQGGPVFLAVGRIRKPHGLKGEVSIQVLTDFPDRLKPGLQVYLGPERKPVTIATIRGQGKQTLVTFDRFKTREAAAALRNLWVAVLADDRPPLPEGDFYHHEMIGLQVLDSDGRNLGTIREILVTGANDVYVVRPEGGPEVLIPALDFVVIEVDLPGQQMIVALPPGLL